MPTESSAPAADPVGLSRTTQAADRGAVLAAVLAAPGLPTPPAVALQVVHAAGRRNCRPDEVVELLSQDPALCAKLLRAVNSCVYGLAKPVTSLERAVLVLGLDPLRSLVLGLSLPAAQTTGPADRATRSYWLASVSGALLARELAARRGGPCPEDDLVAGLLRDLGGPLLRRTFPDRYRAAADRAGRLPDRVADAERDEFGLDHAEVSAHLLRAWHLPDEIVEPVRDHHRPARAGAWADRAALLHFVDQLAHLDAIADDPAAREALLAVARGRYGLSPSELVAFLRGVSPKVAEFAALLDADVAGCPEYGRILSAGAETLVGLTVEANRTKLSGGVQAPAARTPAPPPPTVVITPPPGPARPPAPDLPAALAGHPRYRVIEKIGAGGMGAVYRAEHRLMGRAVALKVMAPKWAGEPEAAERFRREVRLAARLSHPNIVAAYDADEAGGCPCLVMEYVAGESLDRLVARGGPLAVTDACRMLVQAAAGLQHAFEQGMVHRDIKPHNLIVGPDGVVKILDFGLARLDTRDDGRGGLTGPDVVVGTPDYMAPEQARDSAAADHRADVYALGCTLFFLLAGRPPFDGRPASAKMIAHLEEALPLLASVRGDVPPGLQAVLSRLTAKKPSARYQTAAEAAAALAPFADGPPPAEPTGRRRIGRAWLIAGGVALAGGIATAVALAR